MHNRTKMSEYEIRGSCSLFACRSCRTKYGWEHQAWCELREITEPSCGECRYYREKKSKCVHPRQIKQGRRNVPYEKAEDPL